MARVCLVGEIQEIQGVVLGQESSFPQVVQVDSGFPKVVLVGVVLVDERFPMVV